MNLIYAYPFSFMAKPCIAVSECIYMIISEQGTAFSPLGYANELTLRFKGCGAVDYVKVSNLDGKVVYEENFDPETIANLSQIIRNPANKRPRKERKR